MAETTWGRDSLQSRVVEVEREGGREERSRYRRRSRGVEMGGGKDQRRDSDGTERQGGDGGRQRQKNRQRWG